MGRLTLSYTPYGRMPLAPAQSCLLRAIRHTAFHFERKDDHLSSLSPTPFYAMSPTQPKLRNSKPRKRGTRPPTTRKPGAEEKPTHASVIVVIFPITSRVYPSISPSLPANFFLATRPRDFWMICRPFLRAAGWSALDQGSTGLCGAYWRAFYEMRKKGSREGKKLERVRTEGKGREGRDVPLSHPTR